MAKPLILIVAAIPVILAIMIAIPMISNPQIPFNAANADDHISVEFTKHRLTKISFGLTDRLSADRTEILRISNDGTARYLLTSEGMPRPEKTVLLEKADVKRLTALVKETGFMQIPIDSISADEHKTEYTKFSLKVVLNGNTKQIQWVEQNATSTLVPPIVSQVESSLESLLQKVNSQ